MKNSYFCLAAGWGVGARQSRRTGPLRSDLIAKFTGGSLRLFMTPKTEGFFGRFVDPRKIMCVTDQLYFSGV